MANKRIIRRSNKSLNILSPNKGSKNIYAGGGTFNIGSAVSTGNNALSQLNTNQSTGNTTQDTINTAIYGDSNQDPLARLYGDWSGKSTQDAKKLIQSDTFTSNAKTNEDLMNEWSSMTFLDKQKNPNIWAWNKNTFMDNLKASGQGASAGAVAGPWGALVGGIVGGLANIGSRAGARKRAKSLNREIEKANQAKLANFNLAANNISKNNQFDAQSTFYAFGGDMTGYSALDYETNNNINLNNQMSNMADMRLVSMPNSFQNMNNFEGLKTFGEGGNLYSNIPDSNTHGGNFSNGLITIGNGNVHEGNPYGGVPMGVDENGKPNLVEQGEVIYNNYVYSNRLFSKKNDLAEVALPTKYDNYSFAKIAEELNKEASERPNDPISKRGLKDSMMKLKILQDRVKEVENKNTESNTYAWGTSGNGMSFGRPVKSIDDYSLDVELPQNNYSIYSQNLNNQNENFEYIEPIQVKNVGRGIKNPSSLTLNQRYSYPQNENFKYNDNNIQDQNDLDLSYLRYAPVIGSALGAASSLFSSPDYSNANAIRNAGRNLTTVGFKPVGEYLTYKPMDKNFYLSKLNANAGATRSAILNNSGGNRATANAALLAADYNYNNSLGDLARQAEEYDFNQRAQVAGFNRGTNQFNSEGAFRAAATNKQNDELRFNAAIREAMMREGIDEIFSENRSANLTNFFDNIGNVGKEEYSRKMITSNPALYYSIGRNGQISYKNGYENLSEAEKQEVQAHAKQSSKKNSKKHGGYLTIK